MLRPHFPSPLAGVSLVVAAWRLTMMGIALQVGTTSAQQGMDLGGIGIAMAIALGLAATLAARRVPEPQALRLGLVGFSSRFVPMLLLLLPFVVVASEIDNWVAWFLPPTDLDELRKAVEEARANDTALSIAQRAIFLVGIQPVVVEWLLRGVVQQGAIAYLGRLSGVGFTAVVGLGTIALGSGSMSSALLSVLAGALLGVVRVATGSLLAPIVLHMGWSALGVLAVTFADELPIPGLNQLDGSFTSPVLLLASVASVAFGLVLVARALPEQPVVIPVEPDREKDDDERGGWF